MKDSKIDFGYFTVYIKAIIPKEDYSINYFFDLNRLTCSIHLHKLNK